ncbi:MAG: glycosyltransferase [Maritimibacter sp.]
MSVILASMTQPDPSTSNGIQVLGLCRFSVPSAGAFQVEHDSIEERRAFLYDPARLALRFAWFENVTLPGIAAQKDKAFKLVVLLGEDFPEPWRSRMLAHGDAVPQLAFEFAPPLHHRKICADAMAKHIDPNAEQVLQFRLDDDDAVAINFIRRLRKDFRKLRGFHAARGTPMAIDYSKGINLFARNGNVSLVPRYEAFLGVAFAIATTPGDGNHILGFMHHVIWQNLPAVTMPDDIMWVRGGHGTNDSGGIAKKPTYAADEPELRRVLRQRFRIDLAALKAALRQDPMTDSEASG